MKNNQLTMRNSLGKLKDLYKQYLRGLVNIENWEVKNFENGFLRESLSSVRTLINNNYQVS